jgi:succinate dehydrogenase/fumarate reductase flavoprotein subunit
MKSSKTNQGQANRREFLTGAVAGFGLAASSAMGSLSPACAAIPDKWEKEADVVVAGTGFAGLSAAITAHDAGAKVIMLEKMEKRFEGGNSKVSGNMWWTPTNLPEGIQYIKAMCYGLTDDDCIQALAGEMVKLNEWLTSLGIKSQPLGQFQPEHPELPGSACVRTWRNGQGFGPTLWTPVREQVERRKIEVLFETPVKELIQAPGGEVIGIKAEAGGKPFSVRARRGIVLGTGGFEFDFEMQKQFLPGWPTYGRGTPGNTGDGIKMAQKVGAALWHMNNSLAGMGCLIVPEYAPVMIPVRFPTDAFVFVDKLGRRFMNEKRENRHGFGHKEFMLFFDGVIGDFTRLPWWGIFDEATRTKGNIVSGADQKFGWFGWYSNYKASKDNSTEIEKGWILKGEKIPELASRLGIKGEDLEDTITRYNQHCKAQQDSDFGRPQKSLVPLEKGPFYAVKLYPATFNTQGGPKRNAKCRIVDPNNHPIPRLYSAGEMGSFWGWMYNGGGNNAEALCTGRIAGRNVAAEKAWG